MNHTNYCLLITEHVGILIVIMTPTILTIIIRACISYKLYMEQENASK